jgi:hypothetical protein
MKMYLVEQYKAGKDGKLSGPYRTLRIYVPGGGRVSLYLPKGLSLDEYQKANPGRCGEFLRYAKKKGVKHKLPPELGAEIYGSCYPPQLKELLISCGYNLVGSRVQKNRKTFLSLDSTRARFGLLDLESQKVVGSPERLLQLSIAAQKKLKSKNARRLPGASFDSCFAEVLTDELKSGQPTPL